MGDNRTENLCWKSQNGVITCPWKKGDKHAPWLQKNYGTCKFQLYRKNQILTRKMLEKERVKCVWDTMNFELANIIEIYGKMASFLPRQKKWHSNKFVKLPTSRIFQHFCLLYKNISALLFIVSHKFEIEHLG